MTVSSQVTRRQFPGDSSTLTFPVNNIKIFAKTDVEVFADILGNGVEALLVLDSDYQIANIDSDNESFDVVFISTLAPQTGTNVTVDRVIPFTQQTDYVENDDFPAETHERGLDRATMLAQQVKGLFDLVLSLPVTTAGVSLQLPAPVADQFLAWNSTADALINTPGPVTGVTASVYGASLIDDATAKEAKETLQTPDGVVDTGAANTVTLAVPNIPVLEDGIRILFKALNTNTGATTITLNALAAKALVNHDESAMVGGEIQADNFYEAVYELAADNFKLLSPAAGGGVGIYRGAQGFTPAALTPAATVTWDGDTQQNATLTPDQDFTLANITNARAGFTYTLVVTNDNPTPRVITFDTNYQAPGGSLPVLTAAADAVDLLTVYAKSSTELIVTAGLNVS